MSEEVAENGHSNGDVPEIELIIKVSTSTCYLPLKRGVSMNASNINFHLLTFKRITFFLRARHCFFLLHNIKYQLEYWE